MTEPLVDSHSDLLWSGCQLFFIRTNNPAKETETEKYKMLSPHYFFNVFIKMLINGVSHCFWACTKLSLFGGRGIKDCETSLRDLHNTVLARHTVTITKHPIK